jgi:hypothetical protein
METFFAVSRAYELAIEHNYLRAFHFHSGEMAEAEYLDAMARMS